MMFNSRSFALGFLSLLLLLPGCERNTENVWPQKPGPKVLTSFAPIQSFVLGVAGDDAIVIPLMTAQGPHDHGDPTPEHLKLAKHADVLFINGLGLDDKIAGRLKTASGNSTLNIRNLGNTLDKKYLLEGSCNHVVKPGQKHDHDHGTDGHIWLSADHARQMVRSIRDEMKRLDPAHTAGYDARAADYLAKLEELEAYGKNLIMNKTENKIIAFHDSLRYLEQCYGVKIAGYIQREPGEEPSAERLKEIIQLCKDEKVRLIAVEPQFPANTSAKTILSALQAAGIDAAFVEIDPLETADEKDLTADFYLRKMRSNLDNLAKALR